ncbi:MAG: hypothetical protein U5Q44_08635 [Dehalococcoidia bacterium]|nr:hypothetical protein [Dehalococcoidia bacterium]
MFSAELCGGTHVHHTGQLGFIHIVRESAVSAGTRRIEALSSAWPPSRYLLERQQERLLRVADRLGASPAEVEERLVALQDEAEVELRPAEQLRRQQGASLADELATSATRVGDANLVIARVQAIDSDSLKQVADALPDPAQAGTCGARSRSTTVARPSSSPRPGSLSTAACTPGTSSGRIADQLPVAAVVGVRIWPRRAPKMPPASTKPSMLPGAWLRMPLPNRYSSCGGNLWGVE